MSWRASTVRALLALTLLAPASSALAAAPAEAPAAASAKTQTVGELLASFAVMKGFEASFTEEKHLALLAAPLKSSGKLYYAPPGRFARVVEAPQRSTVVITATSLTMTDATGKQAIDLRARPDVKTFVESFLMVLAGDERGLAKVYRLEIAAADPEDVRAGWVLTLTPRGEPLSRLVKGLTLRGHGLHVTTVRVDEVSGDWSEITVRDADPYRAFTDEEKARLFGAPKP
ncbi:MAG: outer membrane lipoprotein carrier protein LolA [Myxococcales bacterium]|nr:outer membrane lipoprotein carrier protein LolA [Myxococcales bacterium]MCB9732434.1 outer membrane lipoprotein carrier protein LolA [Deltaproteobacteria bacterium]